MQVKPYTYLLENQSAWYIGVRVANRVPASEDIEYMSSSKYIKARIASGEVFVKHILGEYNTREEANAAEDEYLRTYWDVPGRVNKALGGQFTYKFDDEVRAKLSVSQKVAQNCPEVQAKRKMSNKAAWAKLEVKAKRSASLKIAFARAEVKAKQSAASKSLHTRPEVKAKMRAAFCKPCTIDGITIYPSRKELIAELGQGKNGCNHPDFRYFHNEEL